MLVKAPDEPVVLPSVPELEVVPVVPEPEVAPLAVDVAPLELVELVPVVAPEVEPEAVEVAPDVEPEAVEVAPEVEPEPLEVEVLLPLLPQAVAASATRTVSIFFIV